MHPVTKLVKGLTLLALLWVGCAESVADRDVGAAASTGGAARPPSVVLISLDGTRPADLTREALPSLVRLAERGIRAAALVPVDPTNTFPNHVSLVTGVRPEIHRLVNNDFIDPDRGRFDRSTIESWIEAEPVWSIAERHGLPTASFYWVGSEGPWTGGPGPGEWKEFSSRTKERAKVDQILEWLDRKDPVTRPRFISSWFHGADHAAHVDGPGTRAVLRALAPQDREIDRLVRGMEARGLFRSTTLIFVSDHGMVSASRRVNLRRELAAVDADLRVIGVGGFASVVLGGPSETRARGQRMEAIVRRARALGLEAWIRAAAPVGWHVDDLRFGDVVVRAPIGTAIVTATTLIEGFHGYPSEEPEMAALFVAYGRGVRVGAELGVVSNLSVAPTVLRLLGLPIPEAMTAPPIAALGEGLDSEAPID